MSTYEKQLDSNNGNNSRYERVKQETREEINTLSDITAKYQVSKIIDDVSRKYYSLVALDPSRFGGNVVADYIISRRYGKGKNIELENYINQLYHLELDGNSTSVFAQLISQYKKYPGKSINEILFEINNPVYLFNVSSILSAPYETNSRGITLCSKTAQMNAIKLGVKGGIPSGDGYSASMKLPTSEQYLDTIPSIRNHPSTLMNQNKILTMHDFYCQKKANFADVYTSSNSEIGHRCCAFLGNDGKWYILDPYNTGGKKGSEREKPQLLSDYMKRKKVLKASFYRIDKT